MVKPNSRRGLTLPEILIVLVLVGGLLALGPQMLINFVGNVRFSLARMETQRDARIAMDLMVRELRQSRLSSINITALSPSHPPHSKINFTSLSGTPISFWQDGRRLKMSIGTGAPRVLSNNLRFLVFGKADRYNFFISIAMEKEVLVNQRTARKTDFQKIRIMNT